MHEPTLYNFARSGGARETLRFQHHFQPHELDKMQNIFHEGMKRVGSDTLNACNHEDAFKHMREYVEESHGQIRMDHKDWDTFESTLKHHAGIKEGS